MENSLGSAGLLSGTAGVAGGALLVAKRLWDYFARGQVEAHTGYPDKDLTDRLVFLVPILMLIAFVGVWRRVGARTASRNLGVIGFLFQAIGEFGEAWYPHGMPWGSVGSCGFLLIGASLVWIGLASLRWNRTSLDGWLTLWIGACIPLQVAAVMVPYHLWSDKSLSAQAGLVAVVVFGLGWIAIGARLVPSPAARRQTTPPARRSSLKTEN